MLESGWMWGGRPARKMSKLDEARRKVMAENIVTYCQYSQVFRAVQQAQGFGRRRAPEPEARDVSEA